MGVQQWQCFCNRCQRVTLHARPVYEFNHVLHLLVTLFCCFTWLPVWILLALLHQSTPDPFRCQACGQVAGKLTEEQLAFLAAEKERWRAERRARRRQRRAEQWAQLVQAFVAWRARIVAFARNAWAATLSFVRWAPGAIDRLCRRTAGEGNTLIYRFLQVLAVVLPIALILGCLWTMAVWLIRII